MTRSPAGLLPTLVTLVTLAALAPAATGCAPSKPVAVAAAVRAEESPEKLLARGRAFMVVADFARAEQYFATALDHGADPRLALPLLLRACAEEKRFRAAIDYAEPELRRHPDDVKLRFVVASLYTTIGDVGAARTQLERVVKDRPDLAAARFALGVLLRDEQGDPVQADAQFREYLRLEPAGAHSDEARGSLLKLVNHSAIPITTPPPPPPGIWHNVTPPEEQEEQKQKGKAAP
jgi:tetratricopeptide (TPR) repeat protein